MKLEGAYEAIESNPLLSAGIQIKGYLLGGCLNFSLTPPVLEHSPPLEVIDSIAVLL